MPLPRPLAAALVLAAHGWLLLCGTPVLDYLDPKDFRDPAQRPAYVAAMGPLRGPLLWTAGRANALLRRPLYDRIAWTQKVLRIRQSWHLYRDGPTAVRRLEVWADGALLFRSQDPDHAALPALTNRRIRPMVETTAQQADAVNAPGLLRFIAAQVRADHPAVAQIRVVATTSPFPGDHPRTHHAWTLAAPAWAPVAE